MVPLHQKTPRQPRLRFHSMPSVFLPTRQIKLSSRSITRSMRPAIPLLQAFWQLCSNVLIISLTIDTFQHKAIALSTSATMIINFIFLAAVLYIRINGYSLRYLVKGMVKIVLATAIMSIFLIVSYGYVKDFFLGSVLKQIFYLTVLIVTSALCYGGVLYYLHLPELTVLTKWFRQKFHLNSSN